MIDHLSETAQAALRAIQSAEYCIADSQKNMNMSLSQDEEEDEEDIEEEDEENFRVNQTSMIHNHAEYQLIRQARNIQSNSRTRPRYRRRNRRSMIGQKCHSCNTTETPEWRRGPDGARTLCNACGLHYSKLLKKGSIGVQTQNYLITGGMPKVSSSAKQIAANTIKNYRAPEGSTINYPFVLMDPKRNAANEKLNHGTPYRASSPSQRLVSVNPEEFVHTDLPHDNGHPRKPNSSSNANVGPLRIHQWRHQ
ncbi:GATA zinc finger-domain-containing protein [Blakeslea trispora]|nr:GATA zinc finger-domain-containing protein [Blakeslea trispora]